MTLETYISKLKKIIKEHPEAKDYIVVELGHVQDLPLEGFPAVGYYNSEFKNFLYKEEFYEWQEDCEKDAELNAICIN